MAEYIDKKEVIKVLTQIGVTVAASKMRTVAKCVSAVESMEAADAEPVRHGKWIVTKEFNDVLDMDVEKYTCSACGEYRLTASGLSHATNYCPNCGAKMDADE